MTQRTCSVDGCERPSKARTWCTTHYARWKRNGAPILRPKQYSSTCSCGEPAAARGFCLPCYLHARRHGMKPIQKYKRSTPTQLFWTKVDFNGPIVRQDLGSCWVWTAHRNGNGYGVFMYDCRSYSAHRISWFLTCGAKLGKLHVLHRCDNPGCVRPDHLFKGTHATNMIDKAQKERGNRTKLTAATVRQIRLLYGTGSFSRAALGERYGVSQGTISDAIMRRTWRHVD